MIAMDVVDIIRHRQSLVDRELDAASRRERLKSRLKEIYEAQGIAVTDAAIEAGIDALEQQRFNYTPADSGIAVWLARLYVSRGRWGRPVGLMTAVAAIVLSVWYFTETLPNQQLRAELPLAVDSTLASIVERAEDQTAIAQARELSDGVRSALDADELSEARAMYGDMLDLLQRLDAEYTVRVVSRADELSGVWRVPDINQDARNYYLIVEAVAPSGRILDVPITSEEDGVTRIVDKWGIRVSQETFAAVAEDKRDDGIIESNVIGTKRPGKLTPDYRVPTEGGAITEW